MELFKITSYDEFNVGTEVARSEWGKIEYWNGQHSIRLGRKYAYLCMAGGTSVGNGSYGFCTKVYRMPLSEYLENKAFYDSFGYYIANFGECGEYVAVDK